MSFDPVEPVKAVREASEPVSAPDVVRQFVGNTVRRKPLPLVSPFAEKPVVAFSLKGVNRRAVRAPVVDLTTKGLITTPTIAEISVRVCG